MVGRYRLDRRLAVGGMGCVWQAHDERLDRDVAIKLLPRLKVVDDSSEKRFYREARAMGRLDDPRIISIYDIGSADFETGEHAPFIVMELVHGRGLDAVFEEGRLQPRPAVEIMLQVAQALAVAHRAGVIHRDLKPSNIMVADGGQAKVLDFGLARLMEGDIHPAEATLTSPGMVLGSCPYMAPEQALGKKSDPRADLFSLGAVFYEALSGRRAFRGSSPVAVLQSVVHCRFDPLEDVAPDLSPELYSIVSKCLQKDVGHRYQEAGALVGDLRAFLEKEKSRIQEIPTMALDSAPISAHRSRIRRRRTFLAAATALALLLGAASGFLLGRAGREKIRPAGGTWATRTLWRAPETILRTSTWHPDGRVLVVESHGAAGDQLMEVSRENGRRRVLVEASDQGMPVWPEYSPDGRALVYNRISETSSSIEIVPVAGGPPAARIKDGERPHWLDENRILFSRGGEDPQSIFVWNIHSGETRKVWEGKEELPWWSALPGPGGNFALLGGGSDARSGVFVAHGAGQAPARLMEGGKFLEGLIWHPEHPVLLAAADGELLGISMSGVSVLRRDVAPFGYPSFSPDGRALSLVRSEKTADLLLIDPSSGEVECLRCDDPEMSWGSRGPGGRLVFPRNIRCSRVLCLQRDESQGPMALGEGNIKGACPLISPDGGRVAFLVSGGGKTSLHVMPIEGSASTLLAEEVEASEFPSWSPDGKFLSFVAGSPLRVHTISVLGGEARIIGEVDGDYPVWSPDGKWIAYAIWTSDEDPRQGTWIVRPDGSSGRKISDRPTRVAWSPGGSFLYQLGRREQDLLLFRADTRRWKWEEVGVIQLGGPAPPHQEFIPLNSDPSTGGIVLNRIRSRSELVLFTGLDPKRWRAMD